MKNIILSAVTILLFLNNSVAQQYVPIVQPGNKWLYTLLESGGGSPNTRATAMQLEVGGDTNINSIVYTKLNARVVTATYLNDSGTLPYYNAPASSPDMLFALIREDNKKIYVRQILSFYDYRYATIDTAEQLFYDFSLNSGDAMPNYGKINNIDSVLVGTTYRKRFQTQTDTIVEGIGSMYNGLYSYKSVVHLSVNYLCYSNNSVIAPSTNKSSASCFYIFPYNSTSIKNAIVKEDTRIYPNPMLNELNVKSPSAAQVLIYNATGQLVINKNMKDVIQLSTTALSNGMYFLVLKDDAGYPIHTEKLIKQ